MIILDVSSAQNPALCDYATAKAHSSVAGVIVRAEWGTKIDKQFLAHANKVRMAGLHLGVYSFQVTDADPIDEVKALLEAIDPFDADMGVFLDIESRNGQSPGNVTTWAQAFMSECDQARGEETGHYTGPAFWRALGQVGQTPWWAGRKRLWIANYTSASKPAACPPWGEWGDDGGPLLWQKWGNTIWQGPGGPASQKWGPVCPGPGYVKVASAYPVAGMHGAEVDCSLVRGDTLEVLLQHY